MSLFTSWYQGEIYLEQPMGLEKLDSFGKMLVSRLNSLVKMTTASSAKIRTTKTIFALSWSDDLVMAEVVYRI